MKSTQKILIVGLILMVLLNICTLGFIFFKSGHGFGHRMGGKHGPGKFIGKRLDFTEEQEKKLDKLRETHESKMSELRQKVDSLHKYKVELIKNDPFDSSKANAVAAEIGNCHTLIEREMTDHFIAIKGICTKEQLPDFNKFMDHVCEHMPGGHRGFGIRRHESGPGF